MPVEERTFCIFLVERGVGGEDIKFIYSVLCYSNSKYVIYMGIMIEYL